MQTTNQIRYENASPLIIKWWWTLEIGSPLLVLYVCCFTITADSKHLRHAVSLLCIGWKNFVYWEKESSDGLSKSHPGLLLMVAFLKGELRFVSWNFGNQTAFLLSLWVSILLLRSLLSRIGITSGLKVTMLFLLNVWKNLHLFPLGNYARDD